MDIEDTAEHYGTGQKFRVPDSISSCTEVSKQYFEFWKAAGVTHVTLNNAYRRYHHQRMEGRTLAHHLDGLARYWNAVCDLLGAREFRRCMTDAIFAGHEDHAERRNAFHALRIVTGPAGHVQVAEAAHFRR